MMWFEKWVQKFGVKRKRKKRFQLLLNLNKRQKLIISVVILSFILFIAEHLFGKSGIFLLIVLSVLTDVCLYWGLRQDLEDQDNILRPLFILPFLFSLSFGLFYFLIPARLLTRIIMTAMYGVGLYSLFLSQNIFTVASVRTIALLSSARTVSFFITLVCFLFLATVTLSLHSSVLLIALLVFLFSFFLTLHSLWMYTLDWKLLSNFQWAMLIALCLSEVSFVLWFWPSSPKLVAIFLTGFFYTIIGLSHMWIDKRLFKAVLWEYVWVLVAVFFILILFTPWAG